MKLIYEYFDTISDSLYCWKLMEIRFRIVRGWFRKIFKIAERISNGSIELLSRSTLFVLTYFYLKMVQIYRIWIQLKINKLVATFYQTMLKILLLSLTLIFPFDLTALWCLTDRKSLRYTYRDQRLSSSYIKASIW